MQIQGDFVTNSSSTGYIIFVPDSYYARDSAIQIAITQTMKDMYDEPIELTEKQIKIKIPEVIESMKTGEVYYYYDDTDYDDVIWLICLQLFEAEDFVVGGFEIGSEGNTCMTGVNQKSITDVLINHVDLDDMVKTLIKGVNDEKQNTE